MDPIFFNLSFYKAVFFVCKTQCFLKAQTKNNVFKKKTLKKLKLSKFSATKKLNLRAYLVSTLPLIYI